MKQIFWFLLVVIFLPFTTSAQDLKLGTKVGLNYSNLGGQDLPTVFDELYNYKIGFHFGFASNFAISEKVSLQTELYYSRQGTTIKNYEIRFTTDQPPGYFDLSISLHYINIPILLDYNLVNNLSLQAGPQIGFFINESVKPINAMGVPAEIIDEFTYSSNSNNSKIELGLAGGIQYDISKFFIQTRYIIGLTGVGKNGGKVKNRNIQLSLGYNFL